MLMITITVAAGVLLYVYSSGVVGGLDRTNVAQPYTESLTLDYYNWLNPANAPQLTLRNVGSAQITFADFFMAGMGNTSDLTFGSNCPSPTPYVLAVQSSCTVTFPIPTGLTVTSGVAYAVKIVAKDSSIFSFSCIAGSNTH